MAINTKFAQKSFLGLPPWAKGVVAVAVIGVVGYAIFKVTQKLGSTEEADRKEDNEVQQELQNEIKKKPATYADSQYRTFANTIETAGFDLGTDEDAIYSTFRKLKNNTDYLKLLTAWGKPNRTVYEWGVGRKMTLPQYIRWEMSDTEVKKVNDILQSKGITYRV
jgi:hypothetical protein